jgi:FdhE protein
VTSDVVIPDAFERRAARAELLAADCAAARDPLRFAAGLYRAQGAFARVIEGGAPSGVLARDAAEEGFTDGARAVLRFAARAAPKELAATARVRAGEEPGLLRSRLETFWSGDGAGDYLSRAVLKPYLEVLAAREIRPERPHPSGAACPLCSAPPWMAVRRPAADADGASRFLICSLCAREWPVNRIHCPVCAEEDPTRLPSFSSDRHPGARIEACESCHRYIKSIDLTIDGRMIPEVDDLVSLPLDLWAGEEGFTRIEFGLAGI